MKLKGGAPAGLRTYKREGAGMGVLRRYGDLTVFVNFA
jgi:hypothetical protein